MTMETTLVRSSGRPTPRPIESPFGIAEIFFSTTDRKGIIRSGNRVFRRVSKYSRAELLGSPHSIVRHPDMPRIVFKLLWEEIEAGRPIAAYVKNMAKDGSYYWVLATVVPCEGGYLSVRIKPATTYFDAVQPIYQDLLAIEQEIEQDDPGRRDQAMEAARERLLEHLRGVGFADYGAFMRTALLTEVKHREITRTATPPDRQTAAPAGEGASLLAMLDTCGELEGFLRTLVARIDTYVALSDQLAAKVQFALELAEDVQLFSMNALLAATRMSADGVALGAVSTLMQTRSDEAAPVFLGLTDDVLGAADLLTAVLLPVAVARIQAEAALDFVRELLEGRDDERATADDLGALAHCLADEVGRLGGSLTEIDGRLHALGEHVDQLKHALVAMRALELNGRIEAARVAGAEGVVTLFRTIAATIVRARDELQDLAETSSFSFKWEVNEARRSQQHVETVHELATAIRQQ